MRPDGEIKAGSTNQNSVKMREMTCVLTGTCQIGRSRLSRQEQLLRQQDNQGRPSSVRRGASPPTFPAREIGACIPSERSSNAAMRRSRSFSSLSSAMESAIFSTLLKSRGRSLSKSKGGCLNFIGMPARWFLRS